MFMKMEQRQYCGSMKNREIENGQLQLELPVFIAYACIIFEGFYIAQVSELYNYRKNIMKWKSKRLFDGSA